MATPDVLEQLRSAMAEAAARADSAEASADDAAELSADDAAELSADDAAELSADDAAASRKAVAFLIRSTLRRPLTVEEARGKLRDREVPDAAIDHAVGTAIAKGILDDAGFANAWVADRGVNRGYGRSRLQRELRKRKVAPDVIDAALEQLGADDERAHAESLARRRAQRMPAELEPAKVAGRLVGMLVRRGFPSGLAHEVARKVTATDRDWD